MHFSQDASAKNKQRNTIHPVQPDTPGSVLGSAELPTDLDFLHIMILYCQGKHIVLATVSIA